ncbi:gamma-aminobutyric acid receptor subunit alpha-6-like [Pollicipes pollicipes]|uniref:gamma-aminobutyric acid receptor subunit alpha-6-like n=1 Tax=Pollicipes pollicipes TaxID=41117 RepID=UPI0018852AB3|nr:gamma-aminobutyric acid receptor subunit alpha-6-like [Pollicipes pollicipes]
MIRYACSIITFFNDWCVATTKCDNWCFIITNCDDWCVTTANYDNQCLITNCDDWCITTATCDGQCIITTNCDSQCVIITNRDGRDDQFVITTNCDGQCVIITNCDGHPPRQHDTGANVSRTLNDLMSETKYDRRIRPGFGGAPTTIRVNMVIKSLGPISEKDEEFILDCYFRQIWFDKRLQFNSTDVDILSMNWLFLEKVWKPDTFFLNGKKSYLHKITVPNKFLRIRKSGELTYSMRLTIKGSCPMHLKKFPLDSQLCPLEIGSYGYTTRDVIYRWDHGVSVSIKGDVSLAQYHIRNITPFESIAPTMRGEEKSTLVVHFHLKRLTGYFLLQVYIPCVLIVSCSWVSFWITKRDVPGRVSLGITTVLTMTTLGFGSRSSWPRVSYATALDWWVIMCFAFVFASMVEFATINFIEKRLKDKKTNLEELKRLYTERHKRMVGMLGRGGALETESTPPPPAAQDDEDIAAAQMEFSEFAGTAPQSEPEPTTDSLMPTLFGKKKSKSSFEYVMTKLERLTEKDLQDRFSVVDIYARLVFPLLFGALNAVYWVLYLYYITDELETDMFRLTKPLDSTAFEPKS